ncbi:hypothetical protein ACF1BP_26945 [Streptomyces sp. NPDC014735]
MNEVNDTEVQPVATAARIISTSGAPHTMETVSAAIPAMCAAAAVSSTRR